MRVALGKPFSASSWVAQPGGRMLEPLLMILVLWEITHLVAAGEMRPWTDSTGGLLIEAEPITANEGSNR